eukprot:14217337-Alexandrium_andersonii.AAC.1
MQRRCGAECSFQEATSAGRSVKRSRQRAPPPPPTDALPMHARILQRGRPPPLARRSGSEDGRRRASSLPAGA